MIDMTIDNTTSSMQQSEHQMNSYEGRGWQVVFAASSRLDSRSDLPIYFCGEKRQKAELIFFLVFR